MIGQLFFGQRTTRSLVPIIIKMSPKPPSASKDDLPPSGQSNYAFFGSNYKVSSTPPLASKDDQQPSGHCNSGSLVPSSTMSSIPPIPGLRDLSPSVPTTTKSSAPSSSSKDDQHPSIDQQQLDLQLLADVRSPEASRKRTHDQSEKSNPWLVDPFDRESVQAGIAAYRIWKAARIRSQPAQPIGDAEMTTVHEGSKVNTEEKDPGPATDLQLDRTKLANPRGHPKLALKVGEHCVIGNTGRHPTGYSINLTLDGGIHGPPAVSFIIHFNKKTYDQPGLPDGEDVHRFVLQYRLNSVIHEDAEGSKMYMVDSIGHRAFNPWQASRMDHDLYQSGIVATSSSFPNNRYKIVSIKMTVNGVHVSEGGTAVDILTSLKGNTNERFVDAITTLLCGDFPLRIVMWFEWRPYDKANETCLKFMDHAIESRVPPLTQNTMRTSELPY